MSTKTEGNHTAEFLISEAPGTLSRDQVLVTVPAHTTYQPGTVLAKLSATGKHVIYDNAGSDGSESAAAILYEEAVNDTNAPIDVPRTVINMHAEVRLSGLVWDDYQNDGSAGIADLLAKGIKVRE
jgi:hypothetical protein